LKERPLEWKINISKIRPYFVTEESLDFVLEKAKEKVLVWASNLCGFIHDKDDCLFLLEEEYLN